MTLKQVLRITERKEAKCGHRGKCPSWKCHRAVAMDLRWDTQPSFPSSFTNHMGSLGSGKLSAFFKSFFVGKSVFMCVTCVQVPCLRPEEGSDPPGTGTIMVVSCLMWVLGRFSSPCSFPVFCIVYFSMLRIELRASCTLQVLCH